MEEREEVAEVCRGKGSRAAAWELDGTQEERVKSFVERAWLETMGTRSPVNDAGFVEPRPAVDCSIEEMDRHTDINYRGSLLMSLEAGRRIIASGSGGSAISITSQSGLVGAPLRVPYAVGKSAIH